MISEAAVLDALKVVRDPDLHQDIVSLGFIKHLRIEDTRVSFAIELTTPACPVKDQMREQAHAAVMALAAGILVGITPPSGAAIAGSVQMALNGGTGDVW